MEYTYSLFTGINSFSNQTVDLLMNNHNLTLDCNVTYHHVNYSFISYKWKRGNEIIYPSNRYIIINSLLTIVNLTTEDAGQYRCTVYNRAEKQITLHIIQVMIKGMYILHK